MTYSTSKHDDYITVPMELQAFFSRTVVNFDEILKRFAGIAYVFTGKTCMSAKKKVYYLYQTEICGALCPFVFI